MLECKPVQAILFLAVFILLAGIVGCSTPDGDKAPTDLPAVEDETVSSGLPDADANADTERLTVAVSIVPQEAFVKKIAGDLVDIVLMVPPGNSPGNYEPTPQEMVRFSEASLYFALGVPTEAANILPRAEEMDGLAVISLQDEVVALYPDRELAPGRRDPHIWLSPKRARVMVDVMAQEMGQVDGANKDIYTANARAFMAELDELDRELKEIFSGLRNRKFIVFHPAFGYLADDYDLEMYALEEGGKEATPQRMQEMVDLAKNEDIRVIFYQREIDSKQTEAFAEEIGGKTVQLAPLSPNYVENLRQMGETMAAVLQP